MADHQLKLHFACPRCSQTMNAPIRSAGTTGTCLDCQERIPIPKLTAKTVGMDLIQEQLARSHSLKFHCPSCRQRLRALTRNLRNGFACTACQAALSIEVQLTDQKPDSYAHLDPEPPSGDDEELIDPFGPESQPSSAPPPDPGNGADDPTKPADRQFTPEPSDAGDPDPFGPDEDKPDPPEPVTVTSVPTSPSWWSRIRTIAQTAAAAAAAAVLNTNVERPIRWLYRLLRWGVGLVALFGGFFLNSVNDLIFGSELIRTVAGFIGSVAILWLLFSHWLIIPVLPVIVRTIRCLGCKEQYPAVGMWGCGCGYHPHRPRHLFSKCNQCGQRGGHVNCPRCDATILLW